MTKDKRLALVLLLNGGTVLAADEPPRTRAPEGDLLRGACQRLLLLVVTTGVIVEALRRLLEGTPPVHGLPVIVVSVLAGLVMAYHAIKLTRDVVAVLVACPRRPRR